MRTRRQIVMAFATVLLGASFPRHGAAADPCYECEQQCRKRADECREAAPDKLCDMPGMKSVCWMFQNFQCQAAKRYCISVGCGVGPSCGTNPKPEPSGNGSGEPHMLTFDGLRYDYQGAGEFVFARLESGPEVQVRLFPYNQRASVISVASIRFAGHVLTFRRKREAADAGELEVDGQVTSVLEDGLMVGTGFGIRREGTRYMVTAGNHAIVVTVNPMSLAVRIFPGADSVGNWVGLLGDFDGKADNDFKSRDGTVTPREEMTTKILYDTFGHSWRLAKGESFLPYAKGESANTFTDVDFPAKHFKITNLSEDEFRKAHKVCRERGALHGEAVRNCIYDVGLTGDEELAGDYVEILDDRPSAVLEIPGQVGLHVQSEAIQGTSVPVFWSGPAGERGAIIIRTPAGEVSHRHWLRGENPVQTRLPSVPGTYSVDLEFGDSRRSRPITIVKAEATISVRERIGGGETFEVAVTGPMEVGDYVALMRGGEPSPRKYLRYGWAHRSKIEFEAPAAPGKYDLCYVLRGATDHRIIARKEIEVTRPSAALRHVDTVEAGDFVEIEWEGPDGRSDYVDLVVAGRKEPKGYVTYSWVRPGTIKIRTPAAVGEYWLRYVANTSSGLSVLVTSPLVVTASKASVKAPAKVTAGEKFEISWSGPNRMGDFVSLAVPDAKANRYETYVWARKAKGTLKAPDKPGDYEIRYVLKAAGADQILARQAVRIE